MPRLRYIVLCALALPPLLLLVASLYCYIRSYHGTDDIYHYTPGRMTRFRSSGGGFWFETRPWPSSTTTHTDWQQFPLALYPFAARPTDPFLQRRGFLTSTTGYDLLFVAPWWFPTLLFTPIPTLWVYVTVRLLRRRHPRAHGFPVTPTRPAPPASSQMAR